MIGLFGWIDCAANADSAEILDSRMQAAHVETALNMSASSSPASLAASQTHDPVSVHGAGSIIVTPLAAMFWLYRRKADLPAFLLVTRIVYYLGYVLQQLCCAPCVLFRPAFADGGNGDALGDTRCKQSLIT
jgi:type IV secretory pathway TrbL component